MVELEWFQFVTREIPMNDDILFDPSRRYDTDEEVRKELDGDIRFNAVVLVCFLLVIAIGLVA